MMVPQPNLKDLVLGIVASQGNLFIQPRSPIVTSSLLAGDRSGQSDACTGSEPENHDAVVLVFRPREAGCAPNEGWPSPSFPAEALVERVSFGRQRPDLEVAPDDLVDLGHPKGPVTLTSGGWVRSDTFDISGRELPVADVQFSQDHRGMGHDATRISYDGVPAAQRVIPVVFGETAVESRKHNGARLVQQPNGCVVRPEHVHFSHAPRMPGTEPHLGRSDLR